MGLLFAIRLLIVLTAAAALAPAQEFARGVPVAAVNPPNRIPDDADPAPLPAELKAESAIFVQRRLGEWNFENAREILGEPRRRRDASEDGVVTGDIYAFRDPSNRYREFELLFSRQTKTMRSAFIYPWHMTWDECRELWGAEVNTTVMDNSNIFRSYLNRNLDVLADKNGLVINLGIY